MATETVSVSYAAPSHLSARSQAIWRAVVPRRSKSPERLELVRAALESLDLADKAREVIEREGFIIVSRRSKITRAHPLLRTEADARRTFATIWLRLQLDNEFAQKVSFVSAD